MGCAAPSTKERERIKQNINGCIKNTIIFINDLIQLITKKLETDGLLVMYGFKLGRLRVFI